MSHLPTTTVPALRAQLDELERIDRSKGTLPSARRRAEIAAIKNGIAAQLAPKRF